MSRAAPLLFTWAGALPAAACLTALVGLGVRHDAPPTALVAAALALTALPIAGVWALCGRGPWGLALGAWGWPLAVALALPVFVPDDADHALAAGVRVLAGRDVARAMRAASPAPPAPEAAPAASPECPPAVTLGDDQVALPYEGQGHSMVIPVQFGDTELPMLFDTGASFTTLNAASLAALHVPVPADAPEVTLHTANGDRSARLVVVPEVWVGGLPVTGVTVALCEECADTHVRGLLGLNVSGQFLVTIDTADQQVLFQARPGSPDRVTDVQPWLDTRATVTLYDDDRAEAEASATNRGPRAVTRAAVGIHCGDSHVAVELGTIPPGQSATARARLPAGAACSSYRVTLDHARW